MQAAPRKWLQDGNRIEVENAPTYYGDISFSAVSQINSNRIIVEIETPNVYTPKKLLIRLRHPQTKSIQSVTVNGDDWKNFDVKEEWIVIETPSQSHYSVIANY